MKMYKKVFTFGIAFLMLFGAITSVSAFTYINGTSLQQVTIKDIPAWGGSKYNMSLGSKKVSESPYATFRKVKADAALGNFVRLVNVNKSNRSNQTALRPSNVWVQENGTTVNSIYFSAVRSSSIEPSNTCDATYKFSADRLS